MFAKPLTATVFVESKSKGSKRPQFEQKGVERLAALDTIIVALTARYKTLEDEIKTEAAERFVADAAKTGTRPTNPKLNEGNGSCGFEVRARSSASALTDEEYEQLLEAGVPVEEKVISPMYLAVNPEYATNSDLLEKADKYLSGKPGIPSDFIVQIPEVSRKIASSTAIDTLCASKDSALIESLLPLISVLCVSKVTSAEFNVAVERVLPELATLCGVKLKA